MLLSVVPVGKSILNVPDAKDCWEIRNYVLLVQEKDTLLSLGLFLNSVDSLLIVILLLRMFSFDQWSVFDENILNKDTIGGL